MTGMTRMTGMNWMARMTGMTVINEVGQNYANVGCGCYCKTVF